MKKLLSFVLCVVLIGSAAVPAFAVDTSVDYCRVKIVVDGATIVPKDADGKPVEPFIWKGTTYLPVRSVANALGLEVGWEPGTVKLTSGAERTAAIGKPTESQRTRVISMGGQDTKVTLDGKELALKDAAGDPVTSIISGGVTYLPVRAIADALHVPVLWDGENATVYLGKAIEWKVAKETCYLPSQSTTVYTYDKQGRLIREESTEDEDTTIWTWEYDNAGNLITETYINDDYSSTTRYTYTFDNQGHILTKTKLYENLYGDFNPLTVDTYIYDNEGRLVLITSTYIDPYELRWTHSYEYSIQGNLYQEIETFADGDRFTRTFDAAGNMLSDIGTNEDGSEGETFVWTYDDRGNQLTEHYELFGDGFSETGDTTYVYDTFDNCVKCTETGYWDDRTTVYTYTFNDGNLKITESGNRYGMDVLLRTYHYDPYGNLIQIGYFNGATLNTYEYTPIYK